MIRKIKLFIKRLKLCLKFLFNVGDGQWQILFSSGTDTCATTGVKLASPQKMKGSVFSYPCNPSSLILNARKRMIFRAEMKNGWGSTPSLTYSFFNPPEENFEPGYIDLDYLESYLDIIKYPANLMVLIYREKVPLKSCPDSHNKKEYPEFHIHLNVRNYSYEKLVDDIAKRIGWVLEEEGETAKDDVYFYTASLKDDMSYFVSPLDKDKLWEDVSNKFNENMKEEKVCSGGYQGSGLGSKL